MARKAEPKFPKKVFVWWDYRSGSQTYELCIADSLDQACYGLEPGMTMKIAEYEFGQDGKYTTKVHFIPKGAKAE